MAQNALFMIHNPWSWTAGDAEAMRKEADLLDKLKEQICTVYESKTGKSRDEICALMDSETWFDADEAKAAGFVDEITEEVRAAASIGQDFNLSRFSNAKSLFDKPTRSVTQPLMDLQVRITELEASLSTAQTQAQANYSALQTANARVAELELSVTGLTGQFTEATAKITQLEAEAKSSEVRAAELVAARFGSDPAVISGDEPTNAENDNELAAKIRNETNPIKRAELYARWKTLTNKK
jgi:chromosome segregation ATPase